MWHFHHRNELENPPGIETVYNGVEMQDTVESQRIRKPARDWNDFVHEHDEVRDCDRNELENPPGIETKLFGNESLPDHGIATN